jgi:hypothetical protein
MFHRHSQRLARIESMQNGGDPPNALVFDDYRLVNGIEWPHRWVVETEGIVADQVLNLRLVELSPP